MTSSWLHLHGLDEGTPTAAAILNVANDITLDHDELVTTVQISGNAADAILAYRANGDAGHRRFETIADLDALPYTSTHFWNAMIAFTSTTPPAAISVSGSWRGQYSTTTSASIDWTIYRQGSTIPTGGGIEHVPSATTFPTGSAWGFATLSRRGTGVEASGVGFNGELNGVTIPLTHSASSYRGSFSSRTATRDVSAVVDFEVLPVGSVFRIEQTVVERLPRMWVYENALNRPGYRGGYKTETRTTTNRFVSGRIMEMNGNTPRRDTSGQLVFVTDHSRSPTLTGF